MPVSQDCDGRARTLASARSSQFLATAIRILVTGGTFDKEYNERTGTLFFKDTHIAEMLRLGRSRVEVTIRTVMMIDGLEMTDLPVLAKNEAVGRASTVALPSYASECLVTASKTSTVFLT